MTHEIKEMNENICKEIPFIDLQGQQRKIRDNINEAIQRVLDHGKYIMGPEVFELEKQLSEYCNVKHTISCSSGTDAILMILMASGIGYGDAVFLPSFTFTATPEVVTLLGARPIFVDVDPRTYNIDSNSLCEAIKEAKALSLNAKAIIAVDLFGQPADYVQISEIAAKNKLLVIADAAQSFGASLYGKKVGSLAIATATSFFPAKPLGCYGDGGAVFTNDDELAQILRSIRVHGQGTHKYDNVRIGLNARLDTIQAAILLEKLKIFDEELGDREKIARMYNSALHDLVEIPQIINGAISAWAQYTIKLSSGRDRDLIMLNLKNLGIPSMIYYSKPLHLQKAYQQFLGPMQMGTLQVSEQLSKSVLSLPLGNFVDKVIIDKIRQGLAG